MIIMKNDLEFRIEGNFIVASLPDYTLGDSKDWKSKRDVKISFDNSENNVILCVYPMTDFLDDYSEIEYFYDINRDSWRTVSEYYHPKVSWEYGSETLEYSVFNSLVRRKKETIEG